MIISGKDLAAEIKRDIAADVVRYKEQYGREPHLVVILVGHDEIRKNAAALQGKIVLDCCNLPELTDAYHL